MTGPIEDVSSLPGKKVTDQEGASIGEVKEIYAMGDDGPPMWVTVEASTGMSDQRIVFIPLARLKDENGDLRVPYSKAHIVDGPEIDASDGLSAECDLELRGFYGIGTGDQEMRSDNMSYATVVSEEPGEATKVEDVDQLETPNPDKRTDESKSRLQDPGGSETRDVDAGALADENAAKSDGAEGKDDTKDEGDAEDQGAKADEGTKAADEDKEGEKEKAG